jgi:hypothetical protein
MKEMKDLIDKMGISKKLSELGLPESMSNNSIPALSIIESFWVSVWIGCYRFSQLIDEASEVKTVRQILEWREQQIKLLQSQFMLFGELIKRIAKAGKP